MDIRSKLIIKSVLIIMKNLENKKIVLWRLAEIIEIASGFEIRNEKEG